jgi:Uma2 family endonuclease
MLALPDHKMTVDEYLAWAEAQPERYELYGGKVYPVAPNHVAHGVTKFAVQAALLDGIQRAGLGCRMLPNGMMVRVASDTAHEPDALVYCGQAVPSDAVEVPNPIIVVEVLSRSQHIDASAKLAGYFSLPSVAHYLIVDPDRPLVVHHARGEAATITTRILHAGSIRLDPPGIDLAVEDFYPPIA